MKKHEMNEIIREKISDIKESEQMKAFLLEVVETELLNLNMTKARYTREYLDGAVKLSSIEKSSAKRDD